MPAPSTSKESTRPKKSGTTRTAKSSIPKEWFSGSRNFDHFHSPLAEAPRAILRDNDGFSSSH
jgi:hypothetical protein